MKTRQDEQSGIPADIINLVERDFDHWELTRQFIRTCEPLVGVALWASVLTAFSPHGYPRYIGV